MSYFNLEKIIGIQKPKRKVRKFIFFIFYSFYLPIFCHSQKLLQLVNIQHKSSLLAYSELIFVTKKQFCFVKLKKKLRTTTIYNGPRAYCKRMYKLFFSVHFLTGTLRTANLTFGGHSLTTYKSNMNGLSMHRKSLSSWNFWHIILQHFIAKYCHYFQIIVHALL